MTVEGAQPHKRQVRDMRRMTEEEYVKQFVSGHCARLTIPLVSTDHVRKAAAVFKGLAEELERALGGESNFVRVLQARAAMQAANAELKGGPHYKGAR